MKLNAILEHFDDPFEPVSMRDTEARLEASTRELQYIEQRLRKLRNVFYDHYWRDDLDFKLHRMRGSAPREYWPGLVNVGLERKAREEYDRNRGKVSRRTGMSKNANKPPNIVYLEKINDNEAVYNMLKKVQDDTLDLEVREIDVIARIKRLEDRLAKKKNQRPPEYSATGQYRKRKSKRTYYGYD